MRALCRLRRAVRVEEEMVDRAKRCMSSRKSRVWRLRGGCARHVIVRGGTDPSNPGYVAASRVLAVVEHAEDTTVT